MARTGGECGNERDRDSERELEAVDKIGKGVKELTRTHTFPSFDDD